MLCRALLRFVEAMEDSAITTFIVSFSASKLNGRDFFLLLSFFLSLSLSLDELEKKEPDLDEDFIWLKDCTVCVGCGNVTGFGDEG